MHPEALPRPSLPPSNSGDVRLRMGYRPEIDGMRGIAVLAVIINHFNESLLPGGYLGVDMFFVISGFVIMASLAARSSDAFGGLFLGFYARRVRRLLPALILFVVLTGFLLCFLSPDPGVTLGMGRRALFGVSNIQFYADSVQYFSGSAKLNPYTHTWSLGVEEQFYLVFPFLLWMSGFSRASPHGARNLMVMIGLLSAVSLGLFIYLYPRNQPAAYFLMPTRFWEIGAGCLLFLLLLRLKKKSVALPGAAPIAAVVVILAAFFLPVGAAVFSTILAVLATALLIVSIRQETPVYGLLTSSRLVMIGLASYSLYLWHWGVIALSRLSVGIHWWTVPFQLMLIAVLGLFSYLLVESPLRRLRWSPFDSRIVAIGAGGLITGAMILVVIDRGLSDRLYLGKFRESDFVYVQAQMPCELMSLKSDRRNWRSCLERNSEKPHVFVLGDSHASNLVPSIQAAAEDLGFDGVRYLTNAIPHPWHSKETLAAAGFWNGSREYRRFIKQLRSHDVVVYSRSVPAESYALKGLKDQLSGLAADVHASGARLVLVDDIPRTCGEEDFRRSFLLTAGQGCKTLKQDAIAYRESLSKILKSYSNRRIIYLDPINELCEGKECFPTLRGEILYVDHSPHFSRANPTPLLTFFKDRFRKGGLAPGHGLGESGSGREDALHGSRQGTSEPS